MHSWVFRHRARLQAIYGRSPVVEVRDGTAASSREPVPVSGRPAPARTRDGEEPALACLELLPTPRRVA